MASTTSMPPLTFVWIRSCSTCTILTPPSHSQVRGLRCTTEIWDLHVSLLPNHGTSIRGLSVAMLGVALSDEAGRPRAPLRLHLSGCRTLREPQGRGRALEQHPLLHAELLLPWLLREQLWLRVGLPRLDGTAPTSINSSWTTSGPRTSTTSTTRLLDEIHEVLRDHDTT
jgi:hypothetical protein